MKIEQIYTGCLAQGAYYITSKNEAVIIDPLREIQPYLDKAKADGVTIKYIFETHFHADFVSGHLDLSKATGAPIIFGPTVMQTGYVSIIAEDGQVFKVGDVSFKLLHTPGHTMESSCYLLVDESGKDVALFSGDTLFIGDVGRPDLAQHVVADLTQEKLAAHMYDSLRNKIMPLSDDIIVYPAHGAGSACGKNLSKQTYDSLGNQKKSNYALNPSLSKEAFIKELTNGLTQPPAYFPENVLMNINGYDSIDTIYKRGSKPLTPIEFVATAEATGAVIIDTRHQNNFVKGFIPGSIFIGIDGSFAVWVGTLVTDIKQPILIVADDGREHEVITRLARVGYDNAIGYLAGGFDAWQNADMEIEIIEEISADAIPDDGVIVDVRKKSEYLSEHLLEAINAPLDYVNESMKSIIPNSLNYVHCASGYRSVVFISILKVRGYNNLVNIKGGFTAIKATEKYKLTDYVCPSTML